MPDLLEQLQTLETLGLIGLKQREPDLEYIFKHVFTQESVYNSLLRTDRRQLHQQVGETLESFLTEMSPGAAAEDLTRVLAYHFEKSGDRDRALLYLRRAAAQAAAAYTNQEARELYSRALVMVDEHDYADRWELLAEREQVLDRLGEREQQATGLMLMQTLATLTGDDVRLATTHNRRAAYFDKISEYQAAAEAAEVGLRFARRSGNQRLQAQSLNLLALAAWRRFDYREVQGWANQALDALRLVEDPRGRIASLLHLGRASYRLGQYDSALRYIQAAQDLATAIADREGQAVTYLILGWIYQRLGSYGAAEEKYQTTLALRRAIGDRYGQAAALSHLGWLAYDQQAGEKGLEFCQQALVISRAIRDRENEAYALSGVALNFELLEDFDQASSNYRTALALHQEIGATTLATFDQAGLARLALAGQEVEAARNYIAPVVEWIQAGNAQRFWDPWIVYLSAYRVLDALGESGTALAILREARTLLQQRGREISDETLRRCFIETVPVNHQIEAAWQRAEVKES